MASFSTPLSTLIWRHIELPEPDLRLQLSFSLHDQNGEPRGPARHELPELQKHFPTLREVSYQHPYLLLVVGTLPPKPWPALVADVPLFLTTDADSLSHGIGNVARAKMEFDIEGEILAYKTPGPEAIMEVFKLVNGKGAAIDRIEWCGLHLRALGRGPQPAPGWENVLPSRINGFLISYTWNMTSAMKEDALRLKFPTAVVADDRRYDSQNLGPGVVLEGTTADMTQRLTTIYSLSSFRAESSEFTSRL